MFAFFRNLNTARKAGIASNPAYLSTLIKPYQLNNHSIAISKPPLLSLLTNYGSLVPAIGIYLSPIQTGYKPLIPVIDVLSGQIFSTDPRGGLSVPVLRGEPRVFLPLDVYNDPSRVAMESWNNVVRLDIDAAVGNGVSAKSPKSPGSPLSPGTRKSRGFRSIFGRKHSDF